MSRKLYDSLLDEFKLQLFAEPEGTEDDDPEDVDDELEQDDDDLDIEALVSGEEETEEDDGAESEEEAEQEPDEYASTAEAKTFTEEDVNRIIQERLARDRKSQAVRELEQITGMGIDDIIAYTRNNKIEARAEELGISTDEARAMLEKEERLAKIEQELAEERRQREFITKTIAYNQAKAKYANNPLIKKYEKEIDAFSGNGMIADFEVAMNYILGQKVIDGEILNDIKAAAEQKTLANVAKRSKVAPEKGGQGGVSLASSLTKQEKLIAAALGISPKEYARNKGKK